MAASQARYRRILDAGMGQHRKTEGDVSHENRAGRTQDGAGENLDFTGLSDSDVAAFTAEIASLSNNAATQEILCAKHMYMFEVADSFREVFPGPVVGSNRYEHKTDVIIGGHMSATHSKHPKSIDLYPYGSLSRASTGAPSIFVALIRIVQKHMCVHPALFVRLQ